MAGPNAMALMTVKGDAGPPTLAEAARQLGTKPDALDASFGVQPVDPANGVWTVRVRADRVPGGTKYSDPEIGPFTLP